MLLCICLHTIWQSIRHMCTQQNYWLLSPFKVDPVARMLAQVASSPTRMQSVHKEQRMQDTAHRDHQCSILLLTPTHIVVKIHEERLMQCNWSELSHMREDTVQGAACSSNKCVLDILVGTCPPHCFWNLPLYFQFSQHSPILTQHQDITVQ